MFYKDFKG